MKKTEDQWKQDRTAAEAKANKCTKSDIAKAIVAAGGSSADGTKAELAAVLVRMEMSNTQRLEQDMLMPTSSL